MTEKQKSITYKDSGVDIQTGNEFVKKLPSIVNSTFDKNVINGIGDFAALYSLENEQLSNPILVSACDGVGTKIKLAIDMKNYSGIGQDLVAMNINDLICTGAKPLFFLDYLSMSKLNIGEHSKVIESIALACKKAKVSLIGGETAEMPGIYSNNDFDLAGFAVGIVDRFKKLPKEIRPGDLIYGLPSSGPHSNGFTLIRKLLEKETGDDFVGLKNSLLSPTKLYSEFALDPIILNISSGFAHITGGGISDNLPRILRKGLSAKIQLNSWKVPYSLKWAIKSAQLSQSQALQTFNCGIGFIAIIPKQRSKDFETQSEKINERVVRIGEIIDGHRLKLEGSLNID
ncbi:phosphoribosylformylglycinamidine cyclo-ligase [Paracoccaceae bacterium]|nr:phosphoribosylformylglycinamidine cyclo-ligase [Paracoccaceae bacterium]